MTKSWFVSRRQRRIHRKRYVQRQHVRNEQGGGGQRRQTGQGVRAGHRRPRRQAGQANGPESVAGLCEAADARRAREEAAPAHDRVRGESRRAAQSRLEGNRVRNGAGKFRPCNRERSPGSRVHEFEGVCCE